MKKILFSLAILLLLCQSIYSKPVTEAAASTVAANYFSHLTGLKVSKIALTYTEKNTERALYYAFTINGNRGFILIAADDRSLPVLGYSSEGGFVIPNSKLVGIGNWLKNYANEVNYIVVHNLPADASITEAWAEGANGQYGTARGSKNGILNTAAVAPLLPCNWNQNPYYNDQCPYDSTAKENTVTGCPATAMAQIMKKWAYPEIGAGEYQYASPKYGTLSANFGAATYNWTNMPDSLSAANSDVAILMFQIGVACQMEYGTAASGGSGAYVIASASPNVHCSEYAFKTYFRYDSTTLRGLSRSDFGDSAWLALLKADLDLSRPMQYCGYGAGGGHTWVCDGYDASDNFHQNWGWGGYDNGFYPLTKLNPGVGGTGAGDGDFNGGQQCLLGIQPIKPFNAGPPVQLEYVLADSVRISPNPVGFSKGFTVTAKISNKNTTDFMGSISARLFDQAGIYIEDAQVLSNQTIAAGATTDVLTFVVPGVVAKAGQYSLGIYESDNGKDWTTVRAANFANPVPLTIAAPTGAISLAGNINLLPTDSTSNVAPTDLTSGGPILMASTFKNSLSTLFTGVISADIYDLAGNLVQNISTYTETVGLAPGATYPAPITFSTTSVLAAPGSYLVALTFKDALGDSGLCGGGQFTNPISLNVLAPVLRPDKYEPDNTPDSAYVFTPVFAGGSTTINTTDANLLDGADQDYYSVTLPTGFAYTVTPALHDVFSDSNLYKVDAALSYIQDGVESSIFHDTAVPPIMMTNGGTLIFHVAGANEGAVGTYSLQITATQSPLSVRNLNPAQSLSVYPNPARSEIYLSEDLSPAGSLEILNMLGAVVKNISKNELSSNRRKVDVSDLSKGVYLLKMNSADPGAKIATRKLVIAR